MNVWQSVIVAVGGLTANKMRSFLTMLGIIIGVAVVIIMISIGDGARLQVSKQVETLGSNILIVTARTTNTQKLFLFKDLPELKALHEGILGVAPTMSTTRIVMFNGKSVSASLDGTTQDYQQIRNVKMLFGRFLIHRDVIDREPVAVIGRKTAESLFGSIDPVGQIIKVRSQPLRIIGVIEQDNAAFNSNDLKVFVPFTTMSRLTGLTRFRTIYVGAKTGDYVPEVYEAFERYTTSRFGKNLTEITSQDQILATVNSITGTLTAVLSAIAAVSLVVGGIGIMNIMLVSVTERTREIGVRKAVGAKRRDILLQFLIEAMLLSVTGGAIGIAFGYLASSMVSKWGGWPLSVPLWAVILAVAFSGPPDGRQEQWGYSLASTQLKKLLA